MALKLLDVERTLAPASGRAWVQVHDYLPEDAAEKTKRGRIVALIAINTAQETETMKLVTLGREVLAYLHEQYYGNLEGGVLERLKQSLQRVNEEFGEQVAVATLIDTANILYAGTVGGVKVYTYWDGKSGFVGSSSADASKDRSEGKTRVFSMEKKDDVSLVLGTADFWQQIGSGRMKALFSSGNSLREIAEELAVVVGSDMSGSGVGAAITKVGERAENEIVELETATEKYVPVRMLPNLWGNVVNRWETPAWTKKVNFGFVVAVLLGVLIIGGGIVRNYQINNNEVISERLAFVEQRLKEADILADTNPSRAKELLSEVRTELDKLSTLKNEKVKELTVTWEQVLERASGRVRLTFSEVFDAGLVREGFAIERLNKTSNSLLLLDSSNSRMIVFDVEKGTGSVVLGSDNLGGVRTVAYYPGRIYLLGSDGVQECSTTSWQCTKRLDGNQLPQGMTGAGVWAGNIYVLDGQEGKIWKYAQAGSGFGNKVSWMEADEELKGAESMQIDGRIWTAFLNGGIGKYNMGKRENFEITGFDESLGSGVTIYTSEETTKIYVLDSKNGRIAVIDKEGKFVRQFVADIIGKAKGMAVFEDKGQLYLPVEGKIYKADLP